jgi:hypothetical protein
MDRLKEILSYFLAAMAMLSLLCAVYEAMNQRLASAGTLAGIFIAAALLMYLPQLEAFSAFGVEARMQKTLDRAQEILDKVREVSIASAKSAYLDLAWSGRLGGVSFREKQKVLDSVDQQLRRIGVKDDELRAIVQPYIELIGYDFIVEFYNMARGALLHNRTPGNEGAKVVAEWEAKWTPNGVDPIRSWLVDGRKLTSYFKQQISRSAMPALEYDKLARFADKIGELYEGCRNRGGYTDEALSAFESYRDKVNGTPEGYYNILMAEP